MNNNFCCTIAHGTLHAAYLIEICGLNKVGTMSRVSNLDTGILILGEMAEHGRKRFCLSWVLV